MNILKWDDLYKGVERIDIKIYRLNALHLDLEKSLSYSLNAKDRAEHIVRCDYPTCTSEGYNLYSVIVKALIEKRIVKGSMSCSGKLHSRYSHSQSQTCDCSIEYEITPVFFENNNANDGILDG